MSDTNFYAGSRFIVPGAEPVVLPNRPTYLPRFYEVKAHPQYPDYDLSYGRIFVYMEDVEDRARMRRIRDFTKNLKIPKGSKAHLINNLGTLSFEWI